MPRKTKQSRTIILLFVAALLAAPASLHAQVELKRGVDPVPASARLVVSMPGIAGETQAKVLSPRDYFPRLRDGTLREINIEVPSGVLNAAFARAHRTASPISNLTVNAGQGTAAYMYIRMENVQITSYSLSGNGAASMLLRWARASQASRQGPPAPGIEGSPVGTAGAPQRPPAPGIEGSPVGTAGAPTGRPRRGTAQLVVADLLLLNGLQVGSKVIAWGEAATIPAAQASAKGRRCELRYRYSTMNRGDAVAGPATNLIMLDSPTGAVLAQDALPGLAVAAHHTSSGVLLLAPGTWTLYVHADGKQDVAESDEQNNLRRVRVELQGNCG
jgi:hypothetical protein